MRLSCEIIALSLRSLRTSSHISHLRSINSPKRNLEGWQNLKSLTTVILDGFHAVGIKICKRRVILNVEKLHDVLD